METGQTINKTTCVNHTAHRFKKWTTYFTCLTSMISGEFERNETSSRGKSSTIKMEIRILKLHALAVFLQIQGMDC